MAKAGWPPSPPPDWINVYLAVFNYKQWVCVSPPRRPAMTSPLTTIILPSMLAPPAQCADAPCRSRTSCRISSSQTSSAMLAKTTTFSAFSCVLYPRYAATRSLALSPPLDLPPRSSDRLATPGAGVGVPSFPVVAKQDVVQRVRDSGVYIGTSTSPPSPTNPSTFLLHPVLRNVISSLFLFLSVSVSRTCM